MGRSKKRKGTIAKYLEFYNRYITGSSFLQIGQEYGCTGEAVRQAVRWVQAQNLSLANSEYAQALIDAKQLRIRKLYVAIDEIETKWGRKDGYHPASATPLYKEIRELETQIQNILAIYDRLEIEEESDDDAIEAAYQRIIKDRNKPPS